ncbi:hypothetical protein B0H14DRAFT_3595935, partial [Mycena olivaceomarginata]
PWTRRRRSSCRRRRACSFLIFLPAFIRHPTPSPLSVFTFHSPPKMADIRVDITLTEDESEQLHKICREVVLEHDMGYLEQDNGRAKIERSLQALVAAAVRTGFLHGCEHIEAVHARESHEAQSAVEKELEQERYGRISRTSPHPLHALRLPVLCLLPLCRRNRPSFLMHLSSLPSHAVDAAFPTRFFGAFYG